MHRTELRFRKAISITLSLVILAFVIFLTYLGITENVHVETSRDLHDYIVLDEYSSITVDDPEAPAGIRKEYRWHIDNTSKTENCLCFYLYHHHASVYINGEAVYKLSAADGNRIGDSISSNWITVPLKPSDNRQEILIILTPLFKSMVDFEPEFLFGSHFNIVMDQLRLDIPQIFIALLCFFVGMFIIVVQTYFILRHRSRNMNMIYLGVFSMLLGIWRITDLKSSPFLFPGNPMILGYICLGALFMCAPTLIMHISTFYRGKKRMPMLILSMASVITSAVLLILQIFSILDFRQSLPVCHAMLIVTICDVIIFSRREYYSINHRRSWLHFLILTGGVSLDLLLFYLHGSSSYIICTPVAFVVYSMVIFVTESLDNNRKAYVDAQTGLLNRGLWTELMADTQPVSTDTCILMIDLNNLKQVNDSLGHEAGDELISAFSRLLHTAFPSNSVICRWGGDEFTVLLKGRDAQKYSACLRGLHTSVERYNARAMDIHISYAAGYALSSEFPGKNLKELLAEADARMYTDKRHIHSQEA